MLLVAQKTVKQVSPEFFPWLDDQLESNGWTDSYLAKRAGISHSVLSKARGGLFPIGWDAAAAIARALGFPEEFVFRQVGLIEPEEGHDATYEELRNLYDNATLEGREALLRLARELFQVMREQEDKRRKKRS